MSLTTTNCWKLKYDTLQNILCIKSLNECYAWNQTGIKSNNSQLQKIYVIKTKINQNIVIYIDIYKILKHILKIKLKHALC